MSNKLRLFKVVNGFVIYIIALILAARYEALRVMWGVIAIVAIAQVLVNTWNLDEP